MGPMDGWLTTKKRGRDDAQINRDRQRALEARRPSKKSSTRSRKPPLAGKKQPPIKNKLNDDDDDDDDLDDFVVADEDDDDEILTDKSGDEDELIYDGSSDEEGDESVKRKPRASKKANAKVVSKRKQRPPTSPSDDEDSDDDEEGGTFFRSYPTRTSRPPPALRKLSRPPTSTVSKVKQEVKKPVDRPFGRKGKENVITSKPKSAFLDLMSSDEEISVDSPIGGTTKATSRFFAAPKMTSGIARVSSSTIDSLATSATAARKISVLANEGRLDDSGDSEGEPDSRIVQPKSNISSKKLVVHKRNDDGDDWPVVSKPRPTKKMQPKHHDSDDDDFPAMVAKPNIVKKKLVVREDDEASPMVNRSFQQQQQQQQQSFLDDSSVDDDEAVALAWALKESQAMANSPTVTSSGKADTETTEVIQVDEQGDGDDESMSEDAVVASVVLATANSLSSQVLQTMTRWSRHNCASASEEASKVPQGLLVDGALALHSGIGEGGSPDPSWISKELMQSIMPNVQLKDYQLIGVNWIALLHRMKCEIQGRRKTYTHVNGILADEMGLGKTVQTIAFLAWLKHANTKAKSSSNHRGPGKAQHRSLDDDDSLDSSDDDLKTSLNNNFRPHIIITPSSVLSNWKREFEKFCPDMNVTMYNGSTEERKDKRNELRYNLTGGDEDTPDVILTCITYFSSELADDRNFFKKFQFDYMVIDEGHSLKSPASKRYKNLDMMRTNHRLLLTGTPVQNSPKELMALLCFLMPLFSGKTSTDDYSTNDGGKSMLQHFVQMDKGSESDKAAYEKLKQLFAPFVLRRTKNDVLSQILPEKERRVEILALDTASLALYNSILATQCKKAKKGIATDDHSTRWSLFTDLRKSANHPLLLRTRYNTPEEVHHLAKSFMMYGFFTGDACTLDKVKSELETFNDLDIHLAALELIEENPRREKELSRYVLEEDDLFSSAKFVRLRQLLPELISGGHRVLIFSQWTRVLDLLGILLENLGLQFLRLDGSVATGTRQALIDRFNEDNSIQAFLLSTRAGGLGINLTSADTCIMHDLDFNPFNDLQAEDRCHRIGQKNKVTVIKMVAKDTVDEYIYNLQQRKSQMNAAIMENPDSAEWFKKTQVSDMECILQTALDQFRSSTFGKKLAVTATVAPKKVAPVVEVDDEAVVVDADDDVSLDNRNTTEPAPKLENEDPKSTSDEDTEKEVAEPAATASEISI